MSDRRNPWWHGLLLLLLLVVLLPVVIAWLVLWFVAAVLVLMAVWTTWWPRGRYALVVYSNSPIWAEYFEARVIPAIGRRGIVLNWSERTRWKRSLAVAAFRRFSGDREFNPLVIIFPPLRWPRRFRFYRAFASFKHGRPEEVEAITSDLLRVLDRLAEAPSW